MLPKIREHLERQEYESEKIKDEVFYAASVVTSIYVNRWVPLNEFILLAKSFRRKVSGGGYSKIWRHLEPLLEYKKFWFGYYSKSLGIGRHGRFAEGFTHGEMETMRFKKRRSTKYREGNIEKLTKNLLMELEIDLKSEAEVDGFIERYASDPDASGETLAEKVRNGIKTGEEITAKSVKLKGEKRYRPREQVTQELKGSGKTLVEYVYGKNVRWYAEQDFELERFVSDRVYDIKRSMKYKLMAFVDRDESKMFSYRNDTNRRNDTNLTNLNNELLGLYSLEGERLAQIDICNSQPLLLAHLFFSDTPKLKGWLYKAPLDKSHKNTLFTFLRHLTTYKAKHTLNHTHDPPLPYPNQYPNTPPYTILGHEKSKNPINTGVSAGKNGQKTAPEIFFDSAVDGTIYEALARRVFKVENIEKWQRSFAKGSTFQIVFDGFRGESDEKTLFREEFGEVVDFVDGYQKFLYHKVYRPIWDNMFQKHLKAQSDCLTATKAKKAAELKANTDFRKKYGKSCYKYSCNQLAIGLQAVESALMIDVVLNKLLKKRFKVFSKHDSILCKQSDLPAVEKLMRSELDKFFGKGLYSLKIE